ncbi:MAG: nitrogenase component 1 [Desulfuromonadales bacterium]
MMIKKSEMRELMKDSSCEHAQKQKPACNAPTPGATTGGCAFEGSQLALFPYADAAHLVHGPATCLAASWETRATQTRWQGRDLTQTGFTTDVRLNDIIFGGEEKLTKAVTYILDHYRPEGIFVYATCVTAMIGDDLDLVCRKVAEKTNIPIIPVHSPGFLGGKNLGSRLGADAVFKHLIGTKEPAFLTPYDINLIGEYNVTGDMWQYLPLLEELGIRVLSTWISLSFYGKRDTSDGLLAIAEALGDERLVANTKALIRREELKLDEQLKPYLELFQGKKAVLNTGGNKSWSIAAALQDLGLKVVATSVRKATEDDKAKARQYLGEDAVLMENPGNEQAQIIEKEKADILLAGGRSLYTALKKRISFIDVNQEKKKSYGGYTGLLALAEDIKNSLENPVFKLAGKKAPWE